MKKAKTVTTSTHIHRIDFSERKPSLPNFFANSDQFKKFESCLKKQQLEKYVLSVFYETNTEVFEITTAKNIEFTIEFTHVRKLIERAAAETLSQFEIFGLIGNKGGICPSQVFLKKEIEMNKPINFDDFEMMVSGRKSRCRTGGSKTFGASPTPGIRLGLHLGSRTVDGKQVRGQMCIALNTKLMEMARFAAGDRANVFFSKDRSIMAIERHPKGEYAVSAVGASTDARKKAIGKPLSSNIKFSGPDWAIGLKRLEESFLITDGDIAIEGSRIMAQVNLLA